MSVVKYNLKTFHVQVLLVALIFCAFGGFYEFVSPTLPLFLHELGYTPAEFSFITYILSVIVFILDSALFFVILYSICKHNFMENIANTIISLIIGTVVGYWIGGLLGLLMTFPRFPPSPSIFTISILLSEFGACSTAYLNTKWEHLTPRTSIASERPFGVVLVSALYIILSLLSTVSALMLVGLSSLRLDVLFNKIFLLLPLIVLFSVLSIAYCFIAYGFYRGRRWAWFTVFAFTLMGILLSIKPVNSRLPF
ncbi:MAG: hypothetical protein QXL57_01215 [Candidatus Bathyarchaeia archaeon]